MFHLTIIAAAAISMPADADPKAKEVLERFLNTWPKVQSMAYKFKKYERMCDGTIEQALLSVKYQKPGRVYMLSIDPKGGQEVIYDPGKNPNELTAHKGSFPDLTVNLNIRGNMTTGGEHHIITDVGFGYSIKTVKRGMDRAMKAPAGEKLIYKGEQKLHNRVVDVILLDGGKHPPRKETAKDGEMLLDFANRVGADAYLILCMNPEISRVNSKLDAKPYTVPSTYMQTTEMAIDRETGLPVRQTTRDEKGEIYEQYEYIDLVLNPPLTDLDFDPENPNYNF